VTPQEDQRQERQERPRRLVRASGATGRDAGAGQFGADLVAQARLRCVRMLRQRLFRRLVVTKKSTATGCGSLV
jgi:hypothetical protein